MQAVINQSSIECQANPLENFLHNNRKGYICLNNSFITAKIDPVSYRIIEIIASCKNGFNPTVKFLSERISVSCRTIIRRLKLLQEKYGLSIIRRRGLRNTYLMNKTIIKHGSDNVSSKESQQENNLLNKHNSNIHNAYYDPRNTAKLEKVNFELFKDMREPKKNEPKWDKHKDKFKSLDDFKRWLDHKRQLAQKAKNVHNDELIFRAKQKAAQENRPPAPTIENWPSNIL